MSAHPIIDTDTVYVRLLDEGVDVWRPVPAVPLGDGVYELVAPNGYDAEDERWEFSPKSRVRCEPKTFSGGKLGLVAVASVD